MSYDIRKVSERATSAGQFLWLFCGWRRSWSVSDTLYRVPEGECESLNRWNGRPGCAGSRGSKYEKLLHNNADSITKHDRSLTYGGGGRKVSTFLNGGKSWVCLFDEKGLDCDAREVKSILYSVNNER